MAEKEYIERGALLAEYDRVHMGSPGGARKLIEDAPAADVVEVRHGTWVEDYDCGEIVLSCSLCGEQYWITPKELKKHKPNYCPKCGAKMDKEAAHV